MSPELNVREKSEIAVGSAENTSDKPMFSPVLDIWETDEGLILVADMPGADIEDISVDLSDNTLTISGRVAPPPQGRKTILKEYEVGDFYRQFSLADNIDQEKITATMKDGVLKLELLRLAPTQPRKIVIQTT